MWRLERVAAWLGLRPRPHRPYNLHTVGPPDQSHTLLGRSPLPPSARHPPRTSQSGWIISIIILCFSFAVTVIMWCTHVFDNSVLKLVSIRNDLDLVFDRWKSPPTRPILSVYIFNYTNAEQLTSGESQVPNVQELGPYVFREKMERINVQFNENGTVSFQENRTIVFDESKSFSSMNVTIQVPNVPLIAILNEMRNADYMLQMAVSTFSPINEVSPFQSISVNDFIWGYEDELFKTYRKILSFFKGKEKPLFGILSKRKGVDQSIITMETGSPHLDEAGSITVFDGKDKFPWGDTPCSNMRGSDGSLFPGNKVYARAPLHFFSHNLCRRLPLKFNKTTTTVDGFPVNQYNVAEDAFDFSPSNKENSCYISNGEYPTTGTFNAGPCQEGAPFYSSYPHFWRGDQNLSKSINGLNPSAEGYQSSFQIHERLGISLRAQIKFQLNIRLKQAKFMDVYKNIKNATVLPLAWTYYDSGPLPEDFKNVIYHLTYTVRIVQEFIKWLSLVTFIIVSYFLYTRLKNEPTFLKR